MSSEKKCVIIFGGGLVGALCAIFLARRGYKVTVFEKREDIRQAKKVEGRSINLAISNRGRKALRMVGLEEEVLQNAIPMEGRLLHGEDGTTKSIVYDSVHNQCIFSVGRNFLNQMLLNAAERHENVSLYFKHKLANVNFRDESATVINILSNKELQVKADLFIGADGAYSVLRRFMEQTPLFQFSQTYIEHGYLELRIPESRGNLMQSNHLHIWPRGKFMMIALPNKDNSWTLTLFMPFSKFEELKTKDEIMHFFQKTFPDSVQLIGKEEIIDTFSKNQPSSLVMIKCGQYHVGSKFLIIGDAAHAMVPFYGQGMNAGFEDCTFLNELLNKNKDNIPLTIKQFSEDRKANAHAICDLAMYNYIEMRDLVRKPTFIIRKKVDDFLLKLVPEIWMPLYNSVSFSSIDYAQCVKNRQWQDKVLNMSLLVSLSFAIIVLYYFLIV